MATRKINSVLIANRGEIALRIVRACRELGIESVVAHSEADAGSLPVRLADRAICVGGAPAGSSYLSKERLIGAALSFGIDAIHPGYGFLAENADFAELCSKHGIVFIGPPAEIIRTMGNKIQARDLAAAIGVATIPGSKGAVSDPEEAYRVAKSIGFPLLVKAAAGGGGRGMRIISSAGDLERGLQEAMREAQAAFGNSSVYIERYLTDIRHLEVQVLGDGHTTIHLGERDCTLQRRNQKLVEEARCTAISEPTRAALVDAAVELCQHVGYRSAGTVEFVYDNAEGKFYFIEMNTRIQVEHPVTEMITGIDLVKEQIRIADTGQLSLAQEDVRFNGHAIECRLNAEDPGHDFMPSPGQVIEYRPPGGPGVRVDSHLERGHVIPPFYDSLIAKLITWGRDREEAIERMLRALHETEVGGISTTLPLQRSIIASQRFRSGNTNTRLVSELLETAAC